MLIFRFIAGKNTKKTPKEEQQIFWLKNTCNITLTYHKLPENFDCSQNIDNIKLLYNEKITKTRASNEINNITIVKEHYDLKKNPSNAGLVHLHVLVELKTKMRINKHSNTAKLFIFKYLDKEYYPHMSPCKDKNAYLSYMFKLLTEEEQKNTCDKWSSIKTISNNVDLNNTIKELGANMSKYTKQDARIKLEKHNIDAQVKKANVINYIFNKLPETKEKLEDFIIEQIGLKYIADNYLNNPNYFKIKELIEHLLTNTRKHSGYISGPANTGKTSMVYAAVLDLAHKHNKKYLIVRIKDLDSTKVVNQINASEYDLIIVVFDDVTPEGEEQTQRTYLLNLLSGNEDPAVLKCRYENARFNKKMVKVFTNNVPFDEFIRKMKQEYKVRVKSIMMDGEHVYSQEE